MRLVIEHQNDLSAHVDPGVIVILELRRRNSITRKHDLAGDCAVVRKVAGRLRRAKCFFLTPAPQDQGREFAVCAVIHQRNGLQERIARQRLESRFGELGRNPLNGDFRAAIQGQAPLERIGSEERQVGF